MPLTMLHFVWIESVIKKGELNASKSFLYIKHIASSFDVEMKGPSEKKN